MRRGNIGCLVIFGIVLAIPFAVSALEYLRVSKLCTGKMKVDTEIDAINAVRSMRGDWPFYEWRHSKLFQMDGVGSDGGWHVRKWHEWATMEGFEVTFEVSKPMVEVNCKVLVCGAIQKCNALGTSGFDAENPIRGAK